MKQTLRNIQHTLGHTLKQKSGGHGKIIPYILLVEVKGYEIGIFNIPHVAFLFDKGAKVS